jgi:hypothetical protein
MNQHKLVCTVLSICKGTRKSTRGEKEQQRGEQTKQSRKLTSLSTRLSSNQSVTLVSEPIDIPARSTRLEDADNLYQEEVHHYNSKTWSLYNRIAAHRVKKNASSRAFRKTSSEHRREKASPESDFVFDLDM